MSIPKSKKCWKCRKIKPLADFFRNKRSVDGRDYWCSSCNKAYRKIYYKKNRNKVLEVNKQYRKRNKRSIKNAKLLYSYGIDIKTFEAMLKQQKYKCLVDGQTIDSKTAHVDHNHRTGLVRGLLCDSCNKGLGFFKDDVAVLKRAIKYLRS